MNTNPDAMTVLCFGDSNTNGTKPDRSGRFKVNERWPGVLQSELGEGYYIIEEGLGGRMTDLEHYNPKKPGRNGLTYFKACIDSHMPIDIVIIMLGTNDFKTVYKRLAEDVARALKHYPDYLKSYCSERGVAQPKVLLISPAFMNEKAPKFVESMPKPGIYDEISAQKSRMLASLIKSVAEDTGCEFFDAASIAETGEDGCHLTKESHKKLALSIAEKVRQFS